MRNEIFRMVERRDLECMKAFSKRLIHYAPSVIQDHEWNNVLWLMSNFNVAEENGSAKCIILITAIRHHSLSTSAFNDHKIMSSHTLLCASYYDMVK